MYVVTRCEGGEDPETNPEQFEGRPLPQNWKVLERDSPFGEILDRVAEAKQKKMMDGRPRSLSQWTSPDGKRFVGAATTQETLPPGLYDISTDPNIGLYFENIPVKTEGLLRFPDSVADKVLQEIQNFWTREGTFAKYGLVHKRGILTFGPPGSGKTSLFTMVCKDIIERGGVAIRFGHPGLFLLGMHTLRDIQPETPVVVLMEDIDSILEQFPESMILNILDGVELVNKVCFLASTNFPEKLGQRVINRPSRFDKRIKIGHPSGEARKIYLEYLVSKGGSVTHSLDLDKWVGDTKDFSFAHLRELFIAVVILGDDYKEAIENLKAMKKAVSSDRGFGENDGGFLS